MYGCIERVMLSGSEASVCGELENMSCFAPAQHNARDRASWGARLIRRPDGEKAPRSMAWAGRWHAVLSRVSLIQLLLLFWIAHHLDDTAAKRYDLRNGVIWLFDARGSI